MNEKEEKLQRYRAALAKTKILEAELQSYGYELTEEMDGFVIACTSCGFPKDEGHAEDCNHDLEYSKAECLQRSILLIEGYGIIKAFGDSTIPANDMLAAIAEWVNKCKKVNIS